MSGLDKNRKRNQTICFRMSSEEKRQMEARIIVTGLPKGKFFIDSVLYQKIGIAVGKYQSDRLSLEIRKLREKLENEDLCSEELNEILSECRELVKQFLEIVEAKAEEILKQEDFASKLTEE